MTNVDAFSAKTTEGLLTLSSTPATAGPTVRDTVSPNVLSRTAWGRRGGETIVGGNACADGNWSPEPTPPSPTRTIIGHGDS